MSTTQPLYIVRIEVNKLFGLFDYVLERTTSGDPSGRIMILYGDNGSGKTTILRMIFDLLAPNPHGGHKSRIARTPFSAFEISLSNGIKVRAKRPGNELLGSFDVVLKYPRQKAQTFRLVASEDLIINRKYLTPEQRKDLSQCMSHLAKLNIALFNLADDRTIQIAGTAAVDIIDQADKIDQPEKEEYFSASGVVHFVQRVRQNQPREIASELLDQSINRLTAWIRKQAWKASSLKNRIENRGQ